MREQAPRQVDVCILGAGPAGCACALRLLTLGHSVLLLDRPDARRGSAAEQLPASAPSVLAGLGLAGALAQAAFAEVPEALMLWRRGPEETRPGGDVLVDRHLFAAGLRDAAARAGAGLLKTSRIDRPRHLAPGRWQVRAETAMGSETIACRFLVDARGRAGRLAGRPQRRGAATLALTASWRGAAIGGRATRIEAGEHCWHWGSPEPDGRFGASIFTSPQHLAATIRASGSLQQAYRTLLDRSRLLRACLAGELFSPLRVCDASASLHPASLGHDHAHMGVAALALDPLSSQGILTALVGANQTAIGIHTILVDPDAAASAVTFITEGQARTLARSMARVGVIYGQQARYPMSPFWQSRAGAPQPPQAPPTVEPGPAPTTRIRLAETARLVERPILTEDRIRRGLALQHPALAEPIARLGSVELPPLLTDLGTPMPLEELLNRWERYLPPAACRTTLAWLWQHGVLIGG